MSDQRAFRNFAEVYPDYLEEHSDSNWLRRGVNGRMSSLNVAWWPVYTLTGDGRVFLDMFIGRIRC